MKNNKINMISFIAEFSKHIFFETLRVVLSIFILFGLMKMFYFILNKFFQPNIIYFENDDKRNGRIRFNYSYEIFFNNLNGLVPGCYDFNKCEMYYTSNSKIVFQFKNEHTNNFLICVKVKDLPFTFIFNMVGKILYYLIFVPNYIKNKEKYNFIDIKINKKTQEILNDKIKEWENVGKFLETKNEILNVYKNTIRKI